jgi:hypothetical protein
MHTVIKTFVAVMGIVMLCACSSSPTRTAPANKPVKPVKLWWTASTQAEDGSALTDLKEYRLEYGSAGAFTKKLSLPPATTKYVMQVPNGTWSFRVVAVSLSRGEGVSNEVSVTR